MPPVRSAIAPWIASPQCTASTAEGNSTSREHPVAHRLDDPAAVGLDLRVGQLGAQRAQAVERFGLVPGHHERVANHVRAQDRAQPTLGAYFTVHACLRMGRPD